MKKWRLGKQTMTFTEFSFSIPLGSELNCSNPFSVQDFLIFTWA